MSKYNSDYYKRPEVKMRVKKYRDKFLRPYYRSYSKKYYLKNKEFIANRTSKMSRYLRDQLLALFNNRCCKCGFSDRRALQIDHINGGGGKERRKPKGTSYTWYMHMIEEHKKNPKKFFSMYQLLCANCNWIKRYESREVNFREVNYRNEL